MRTPLSLEDHENAARTLAEIDKQLKGLADQIGQASGRHRSLTTLHRMRAQLTKLRLDLENLGCRHHPAAPVMNIYWPPGTVATIG